MSIIQCPLVSKQGSPLSWTAGVGLLDFNNSYHEVVLLVLQVDTVVNTKATSITSAVANYCHSQYGAAATADDKQ